jgi:hypothetical protein
VRAHQVSPGQLASNDLSSASTSENHVEDPARVPYDYCARPPEFHQVANLFLDIRKFLLRETHLSLENPLEKAGKLRWKKDLQPL